MSPMIVCLCEGRRRKLKVRWQNLQSKHNHQYHRVILSNFFISFHRHFKLAREINLNITRAFQWKLPKETPQLKFLLRLFLRSVANRSQVLDTHVRRYAADKKERCFWGREWLIDSLIFWLLNWFTSLRLKMERKHTSKCVGGPRVEDQDVQAHSQ